MIRQNFSRNDSMTQNKKSSFIVKNDKGLHTRPSTEIVKCASKFKSDIKLKYRKHVVNAKSILGILILEARRGSKITVTASGEDADEAVSALVDLAGNKFHIKY